MQKANSLIAVLLLLSSTAFSQSKKVEDFITKDKEISKGIDNVAKGIDSVLSGKKADEDDYNKTTITLRNLFNWSEGGVYKYSPNIDLRLSLPNLEKKWQVTFSTYDQEQESRGVNRTRIKTTPIGENYGGGLRFLQKLGDVNTEFQPRVELRNGGVQLSYVLKFTSSATKGILTFHPEVQLFARTDKGLAEFVGLNSDIGIYKSLVLTIVNEEQYQDRENLFSTNHGLVLVHDWNDRMAQSYAIIFESSSRPNFHLDRYTVSTGFTHKIYPNVLHYAIIPYLAFPRNLDFKGSPGLNLELDLIF